MNADVARQHPTSSFASLDAIEDPGTSLVCLRRPVSLPCLEPWLARFTPEATAAWGWNGDPRDLDAALPDLLRPLPEGAHGVVGADLVQLAPRFARWVRRRHVRVRFEAMAGDGCRKFHVDYMALRLLVTYAGPGTEHVLDPHVDRSWIGQTSVDLDECNARIVPDPRHVQRAQTGDVLVLKGEHFRGASGRGAVHRSPPIESVGARRLVLKIDADNCGC